jgi:hypothetical protein
VEQRLLGGKTSPGAAQGIVGPFSHHGPRMDDGDPIPNGLWPVPYAKRKVYHEAHDWRAQRRSASSGARVSGVDDRPVASGGEVVSEGQAILDVRSQAANVV